MTVAAIETAIVDRLRTRLGAAVEYVYTAAEVAQVEEHSQLVPSVAVLYNGLTPTQEQANGAIQEVAFQFLAVVAVRNAAGSALHEGARADGSALVDGVMEALLGFRPITNGGALKLDQSPPAAFSDAGFAYYPVAFEIRRTYRGTN